MSSNSIRNTRYKFELLNEAFKYNRLTGVITHKRKTPEVMKAFGADDPYISARAANQWTGKRALNSWVGSRKALVGELCGVRLSAARVAWQLGHKGLKPIPLQIGYHDGNPRNLKLSNLYDRHKKVEKRP